MLQIGSNLTVLDVSDSYQDNQAGGEIKRDVVLTDDLGEHYILEVLEHQAE